MHHIVVSAITTPFTFVGKRDHGPVHLLTPAPSNPPSTLTCSPNTFKPPHPPSHIAVRLPIDCISTASQETSAQVPYHHLHDAPNLAPYPTGSMPKLVPYVPKLAPYPNS